MISKAVEKYLRVSPRKIRLVMALIRGKNANESLSILKAINKKSAALLIKALKSAIANAKRLPNIQQENLYISKIFADGGPVLKRYKAATMGRASTIRKRTSHVTIELDIKEPKALVKETKKTIKQKKEKPEEIKSKTTKTIKKASTKGAKSGS